MSVPGSHSIAILPLLAILLNGCGSLPDPMGWFESDNQAPPTELTDYEPRVQVKTLWDQDSGGGSEKQYLKLVPAVHQGRVVVADAEGGIQSLNSGNGQTVWTQDTDSPISGGPGVGEDLVLVGTRDAEVIALRESDGEELWRSRLSSEILSVPQVQSETIVVHTIDGKLYGLDIENGAQQWVYDRTVPVLTLRGNSSPVIDGSSVIAGFASGKLVNLDLYSGDPRWETLVTPPRGRSELERIVDIDADPVIYDGIIYVCTFQGEVAAVSVDTGVVLWRRPVSSHAGLSADWRHVYVTDAKDQVWALDPHSGAGLWKQDKLLNRRLTAPAILDDYVLVGDLEGYVHWLSYEDGSLMARTRVGNAPISAPLRVVDDIAYVYTEDGVVTAMTAGDLLFDNDDYSDYSDESTDAPYSDGEAGSEDSSGLEDTLGPFDPLQPAEPY